MNSSNTHTTPPIASVVMPSYNEQKNIEAAIRSVMRQTLQDWELLVVDDCSTDATVSIVKKLMQEDERIKLICSNCNQGVAAARNHGLDLCRGDYVALMDSDDIWFPDKLAKQIQLAQEKAADIVYCSYQIINDAGSSICADFIVPPATDFQASLTQSVMSCSTILLSREIVDHYRFSTKYYHEDLALWLQLLKDGYKAFGVEEVLASYRLSSGTRASNKLRTVYHRWKIYRKMMGFSVFQSSKLLIRYALLGLQKYKRFH